MDAIYLFTNKINTMTELLDLLVKCFEYMDSRADVTSEANEDGSYPPNKEMELAIELEEWITELEYKRICPECDGKGYIVHDDYSEANCDKCLKTGRVNISVEI